MSRPGRDVIPLLLRGGPQDRVSQLLPVGAFAVVTALALTVAGGAEFFANMPEPDPRWPVRALYLGLTAVAVAILVVPLGTLGASAVRLSTRRRDTRLASLRLLGAPTSLLRTLTVAEGALLAAAGTALGILLHLVTAPLVGRLHFVGDRIGAVGVIPSWWLGGLTVLTVVGVAVLAGLLGLRRISITPLGVRTRQDAPPMRWLPLLLGAGLLVLVYQGMSSLAMLQGEGAMIGAVLAMTTLAMGVLNLVGPPVLTLLGRIALRRVRGARSAERLLALRSLLDDPRAAWRQVSGVAMVSFVSVVVGVGLALSDDTSPAGTTDAMILADLRTGVLLTVALAFTTLSAALAVHAAAQVFDRRGLFVSLELLGMSRRSIERARMRTALQPLVLVCLLGVGTGMVVTLPLAGFALLIDPLTLVVVAGAPLAGLLVARLAVAGTRPLLRQVLDHAEPVV